MVSTKRKIVRNTIANTLLKISKYAINFFLFPFIIYYVGVEDYGIYLLVGAFVGYFGLLDFGVGGALVKYVAEFNAKEDDIKVNEMVNSTFAFYLGIGIIIALSIFIIGTFYVNVFNIDPTQIEKARLIAYITALGALTSWPIRSFGNALQGLQRYDYNAIVQFAVALINAVVTIILLLSGYGIIELILFGIIIGALGQLAIVVLVQRLLPYLEVRRKYMGISTMKKIFKFSSVVFVSQITSLIILGTDRIVIGAFVSVSAITLYAIARKLHDLSHTASALPSSAILPAATELDTLGKKKHLQKLLIRGGKYKCALILSVTVVLMILAEPLIRFWMGEDYIDMTWPAQVYLSYWLIFAAWGITGTVLLSLEKYKPILIINITAAIGNLILSLILVQWYGILGVILGTVIPNLIILPIIIPYGLKLAGMKIRKVASGLWLKTYPIAGVSAIVLVFTQWFYEPRSLIDVGILAFFGLAIFWIIFYKLGLNTGERRQLKKYVRSIF